MEVTKIPKKRIHMIEPKHPIVDKGKYEQLRVAAYCRVSTGSEEQLTSYKTQMKVYTEMIAAKKEWSFAGMYADEGISGTRADKRPEFKRLINDCLAGKIDYIITKSVSRFARNTVDCLDAVRMLKGRGIGVYFEEQNIDTLKSDSELYLVIYAGFAQSESESISKNIIWTFRKNFENGKGIFIYKKLLGYQRGEDGTPEIVPYEAEIVERIYNMFLSGQPVNVISQTLRSENIQIPGKSFTFSKAMILGILRNEKYCGDCILQKTVTIDCISKTRKANEGEAPMYIVENNHPAIISRELFNRTQEELSRRNVMTPKSKKSCITASGKYSKYALTEVLKCAECGSRYRRCTWTSHGHRRIVWRCINRLDYYENGNNPNRESISRLIVDAVAGKIDCVLVKSPGKLARDAICLEEIAKSFQKSGLTVYTPEGIAQIAPLYFLAYARVASLSQVIGEQEMTDAIQALEGKGFSTQEATTLLSQWYNEMSASGERKPLNWFLENVLPKEAPEISGMQLS